MVKIIKDDKIEGVLSAIYLNDIYKNRYKNKEVFYVVLALKDETMVKKINFYLNKKKATYFKKLDTKNKYSYLLNIDSNWQDYYLVEFETQNEKRLNLEVYLLNEAKAKITFEKIRQ